MKTETIKALDCAVDLISDPNKWTQGAYAVSIKGNRVSPSSHLAVRWCFWGAFIKCGGDFTSIVEGEVSAAFAAVTAAYKTPLSVNDGGPPEIAHAEIVAAGRALVAKLKAERVDAVL